MTVSFSTLPPELRLAFFRHLNSTPDADNFRYVDKQNRSLITNAIYAASFPNYDETALLDLLCNQKFAIMTELLRIGLLPKPAKEARSIIDRLWSDIRDGTPESRLFAQRRILNLLRRPLKAVHELGTGGSDTKYGMLTEAIREGLEGLLNRGFWIYGSGDSNPILDQVVDKDGNVYRECKKQIRLAIETIHNALFSDSSDLKNNFPKDTDFFAFRQGICVEIKYDLRFARNRHSLEMYPFSPLPMLNFEKFLFGESCLVKVWAGYIEFMVLMGKLMTAFC
ncbi:hypothetical protein BJ508DRAFT_321704 [Ascobolus immersus RN42]|uniref:Uncharacterized protein n=1 Tax=Ascobolus immersus RN42 TaxID=1160509 RepID=A0A3N4ILL4_ASCIM|nr:hypothetical protein BJ508DRAFT_321704 [Ascobolus immersus RN42]